MPDSVIVIHTCIAAHFWDQFTSPSVIFLPLLFWWYLLVKSSILLACAWFKTPSVWKLRSWWAIKKIRCRTHAKTRQVTPKPLHWCGRSRVNRGGPEAALEALGKETLLEPWDQTQFPSFPRNSSAPPGDTWGVTNKEIEAASYGSYGNVVKNWVQRQCVNSELCTLWWHLNLCRFSQPLLGHPILKNMADTLQLEPFRFQLNRPILLDRPHFRSLKKLAD